MRKLILLSFTLLAFIAENFTYAQKTEKEIYAFVDTDKLEDGWYEATIKNSKYTEHNNRRTTSKVRVSNNTISVLDLGRRKLYSTAMQQSLQDKYTLNSSFLAAQTDKEGRLISYKGTVSILYENGKRVEYDIIIPIEESKE